MDYEMLGRYTEAKERAGKIIAERQRAVWEIKNLINGDHAPEDVKKIDWAKITETLQAAERLDADLRQAWDDANASAEIAGRPRLGYTR
jgi:hypothetical protein